MKSLCILIALCLCGSAYAQRGYTIPGCGEPVSKNVVGNMLKLSIPDDAILKRVRDVDYSSYGIGFGPENNRSWLTGIFGLNATSGIVPKKWRLDAISISQRTWTFGQYGGTDIKGRMRNGHYWRYFGQFGESFEYYDVSMEAATYFDRIIDNVCFDDWLARLPRPNKSSDRTRN